MVNNNSKDNNSNRVLVRNRIKICRFLIFALVISSASSKWPSSSIPRSTNNNHNNNRIKSSSSSSMSDNTDISSTSSPLASSSSFSSLFPPWNESPQIDKDGFLTDSYTCIPGEWESEANIGGRHSNLKGNKPVSIRQVPGDGNCLFHSITVSMAAVINGTHIDMCGNNGIPGKRSKSRRKGSHASKLMNDSKEGEEDNENYDDCVYNEYYEDEEIFDLQHLYQHSDLLRQKAVDVLSVNPKRLLFLQGNEYLRARDLVNAAAAQYDLSGWEYCDLMRRGGYWGGGPEIVALCNVLKRPIHVYELSSPSGDEDDEEEEDTKERINGRDKIHNDENYNYNTFQTTNGIKKNQFNQNDHNSDVSNNRNASTSITRENETNSSSSNNNSNNNNDEIKKFRLRRMACFGSPKFDRRKPLHILSADSRFPDITPGNQLAAGNHFLTLFPEECMRSMKEVALKKQRMRRKWKNRRRTGVRGGSVRWGVDTSTISTPLGHRRTSSPRMQSGDDRQVDGSGSSNTIINSKQQQGQLTWQKLSSPWVCMIRWMVTSCGVGLDGLVCALIQFGVQLFLRG